LIKPADIVDNFGIVVWSDDFFVSTQRIKASAIISSVRLIANISLAKQNLLGAYICDKLLEHGAWMMSLMICGFFGISLQYTITVRHFSAVYY